MTDRTPALLRRYAPFLALIAVQLLIVLLAPSVGRSTGGAPDALAPLTTTTLPDGTVVPVDPSTGLPTATGGTGATGATTGVAGGTTGAVGGSGGTGGGAGTGATGATTGAPGATGGSATTGGAAAPSTGGDRSKCARGGVLQQSVTTQSLPCRAALSGDNGGATAQGVTRETVTVVLYQPRVNPVINAIIAAAGAGEDPAAQRDALAAYSTFFNKHYELAGRRIEWKTFAGNCAVDPPDDTCLRGDARTIVRTLKPFWVIWPTGRASFFDELSRQRTLNSGGLTFAGSFNRNLRPYHWSAFMDGDRVATNVADYYCKKMAGKRATLAGDAGLRGQVRRLGVLVRQEPANKAAADLLSSLVARCQGGVKPPVITYSQDIATAQSQSAAGVAALRSAGVTTVVSLGSVLEISLQAGGFTSAGFFPENLMSGAGLTDLDSAARIIDSRQWNNAFGPGNLIGSRPRVQDDDVRAWRDAGRTGVPYTQAAILFQEMQQLVWQIQTTGPRLNALEVERASFAMPVIGGWANGRNPFAQRYQFTAQGYTGPSDSRQVYWSSTAVSPADGRMGAYVPVERGRRYVVGTWPSGDPKR